MRMFVALRPPDAVVEDLDEFLDVRRGAGPVLVASFLGEGPRGRPRYETIETFPLGPTDASPV